MTHSSVAPSTAIYCNLGCVMCLSFSVTTVDFKSVFTSISLITSLPIKMAQNINPVQELRDDKESVEQTGHISGNHSVAKRLQKELLTLMTCGDKGISAFPDTDYIFKWTGTIQGPDCTVYEGLTFKLSFEFSSGYPYTAPTVKFLTPCFHPNVDHHGNICLDILKEKWSALYDVRAILLSIQSLLGEPNNESPLNLQAAELWANQEAFKKKLHEKTI